MEQAHLGHDYKGDFNADDRILQAMARNDRYVGISENENENGNETRNG